MKKRHIILMTTLLVVVLILLTLSHPFFSYKHRLLSCYHYLLWGDVIQLKVDSGIDINGVDILFKNENQILKESNMAEFEALNERFEYLPLNLFIFKNGKKINNIPYDYGKQKLQVYYKGNEIGNACFFKSNKYVSNRYYIHLVNQEGFVKLNIEITGPDFINNNCGIPEIIQIPI